MHGDKVCGSSLSNSLTDFEVCNTLIYAKAESFNTGIEILTQDFIKLQFDSDGSSGIHGESLLSMECGGRPSILQGLLDTCQVNADVSKGNSYVNMCTNDFDA